jgi:hypothetical protein
MGRIDVALNIFTLPEDFLDRVHVVAMIDRRIQVISDEDGCRRQI